MHAIDFPMSLQSLDRKGIVAKLSHAEYRVYHCRAHPRLQQYKQIVYQLGFVIFLFVAKMLGILHW